MKREPPSSAPAMSVSRSPRSSPRPGWQPCWSTSTSPRSNGSSVARATSRTYRARPSLRSSRRHAGRDDRLRRRSGDRRDHHRRSDSADTAAGARRLHRARRGGSSPSGFAAGISSCSSRPRIPAPRGRRCCRSSPAAAWRSVRTSSSPSAPSVDPGRTDWTTKNTPKVIGGLTAACTERASSLYRKAIDTLVLVSSPDAAELVKLLENIFRSVNIALVNELAQLCDRMNLDVWEVVEAAGTKPFGFMRFKPGPGLGGHCLPGGSVLPRLEGSRVRLLHRVHRAGRQGQREHAVLLPEKITRALNAAERPCAAAGCIWSASPTRRTWATCASRRR